MPNIVLPIKQKIKESPEDHLLKYLTVKLAPVLVEVKPSSLIALLNCRECEQRNRCELWEKQWKCLVKTLKVSFKELRDTPRGKQMLFYNPEELFSTIVRPENLSYLEQFGYSGCACLNDYLELLKRRFNSSPFPHEIGIFLGYPLKDVQGFIEKREKRSLPLVNIGRWRVFGEPGESIPDASA